MLTTPEHNCQWRVQAAELQAKLEEREAQLAALAARVDEIEHKLALAGKRLYGRTSERMPTPEEEAKKREPAGPRGGHQNPEKRAKNAAKKASLPTTIVHHAVAEAERACPHCGDPIKPIGEGERSLEYEWVPGRLERRVHVVEVGRCPCKQHYARGPAPPRVQAGCTYGPAFIAKLAVDKCADSTPLYRIERAMQRAGLPLARSTLNDLVLLAADRCEPLYNAMLAEVCSDPHLQADETSVRLQNARTRTYVWTFLSPRATVYAHSPSRSGDTPKALLCGTTGSLLVDGHTGYNVVTDVDGRERAACFSHARRYLFEALATAPEAREGLDLILELFLVERKAKSTNIIGTREHLALRERRSRPVTERLRAWADEQRPRFEPPSPMGIALRYLTNQWPRLMTFLGDPMIPIHNNASESALRIMALMRKNSLFFGNERAARRFMILYSLVATCARHDVNPETYLADVLIRVQDWPTDRVAELLPDRWASSVALTTASP